MFLPILRCVDGGGERRDVDGLIMVEETKLKRAVEGGEGKEGGREEVEGLLAGGGEASRRVVLDHSFRLAPMW